MYTDFFSLTEKPFSITPDPAFLFLSKRHEEALAHLIYGVTDSGGFIQLSGEVGTGKTMIIRSLFEQLPENVDIALILNPRLDVNEFLHAICDDFKLPSTPGATNKQCFDLLNGFLLQEHSQGRKAVLLIDEAQNLSVEVLEQIRLLTNLETHKEKLLQIILVGQPELETLLSRQDLRQLAQRITARYYLKPLNKLETRAYIKHRLSVAGAKYNIFKPNAEHLLFKASGGIPRLVNVIADRALLGAFSLQQPTVGSKIVKQSIKEVLGDANDRINKERVTPQRKTNFTAWVLAPLVLAAIGISVWKYWPVQQSGAQQVSANTEIEAAPEQALSQSVVEDESSAGVNQKKNLSVATASTGTQPQNISSTEIFTQHLDSTTTEASFNQLLTVWERSPFYDHSNACETVNVVGLRCLYQKGSWEKVLKINRPVILELQDSNAQTHQVLVTAVDGDDLEIRLSDNSYSAKWPDLKNYWNGSFLVLWQPQQLDSISLAWGSESENVIWLRDQLTVLGMNNDPEDRNLLFTGSLAESVKNFQLSVGLGADGIVGSRTFLALNNALGLDGRPKLLSSPAEGK